MKILLVGLNFWPEVVGVGKYTGELAASLVSAGHEVRVVTAPPYYPSWQHEQGWPRYGYSSQLVQLTELEAGSGADERGGGIRTWRCPLYVPKRPSGVTRLLHLASFAVSSFPLALWQALWRPRLVMVIAPALLSAPGALVAARIAGASAWLHIQDFEVDAAFALGLLRAGRAQKLISMGERWILRRFDRVSTISTAMRNQLLQKGVADERAVLLPNWVDTTRIHPLDTPSVFRVKLGIGKERLVALYSGAMGRKHGLQVVIEAARALSALPIDFVLSGDGPAKAQLEESASGFPNVHILPLQPLPLLNELLNLADIHLLPQGPDVGDLVMPSKLSGMLASGRPVVATAAPGTQLARVLEGCGCVVAPEDARGFTAAIAKLAGDARLRVQLGVAARAMAEAEFERKRVFRKFVRELDAFAAR